MSHLTLVPAWDDPASTPDERPHAVARGWCEPVLDIPGLPPPTLSPMDQPPASDPEDVTGLIGDSSRFADVNAQIMGLFDDVDPQDRLQAGRSFYFDADGTPKLRRSQLRAVGDD